MQTSFGVLIVDSEDRILVGHSTGNHHWDIPKGGADQDEMPVSSALRELWEEFGLSVKAEALVDLGVFNYMPSKQLHLFCLRVPNESIALSSLYCSSTFKHSKYNRCMPEVDNYAWVPYREVSGFCTKRLVAVIQHAWASVQRVGFTSDYLCAST